MMLPDIINNFFLLGIGLLTLDSCHILYRDKVVRGMGVPLIGFITTYSLWGLFYYPHLHQWISFIGAVLNAGADSLWLALAFTYRAR